MASTFPNARVSGSEPGDQPLVLIVDDSASNLKLARDVLSADGLRTLEASTGAEAIELATAEVPDVILLDLRLPDMDGIAVLGELRAHERTAHIAVVALTAMRMDEDGGWLHDAGFSGYLTKPIDVREFPGRVRAYAAKATS